MGEVNVIAPKDDAQLQSFIKRLLDDVRALEQMLDKGMIESGVRRIGAEQEFFLVDAEGSPTKRALEVLKTLDHPSFTTELAQFNLEANLTPLVYGGKCLSELERELCDLLSLQELMTMPLLI